MILSAVGLSQTKKTKVPTGKLTGAGTYVSTSVCFKYQATYDAGTSEKSAQRRGRNRASQERPSSLRPHTLVA